MDGYTGVFTKRHSIAAGQAYTGTPNYAAELLRLTENNQPSGGGIAPNPFYADSVLPSAADDSAPARIRIEFKVLQNDVGLKAKVYLYTSNATSGNTRTLLSPLNGQASEIDIGGGAVVYYDMPSIPQYGPGGWPTGGGAYLALVVDFTASGSTGRAEIITRTRPYAFPGWESITLNAAAMLTKFEPGITNTNQGRASSYTAELAMTKDFIARRLRSDGIDLDMLPSDGVSGYTLTGAPQAYGKYLVPELADAATYLTLMLIHQRFAKTSDDWDVMRETTYGRMFEATYEEARKTLPVNFEKDYTLTPSEDLRGSPTRLTL